MDDYKMILKLYFEGFSQRRIAEKLKRSRNTVSETIRASDTLHLTLEQIIDLSEDELQNMLFPEKKFIPEYVQPDFYMKNK